MLFGLTNAPATFETVMQTIMQKFRSFTARLLDDILIFSQTREEHVAQVEAVLRTLYRYDFVLQTRKCNWFVGRVSFLGFILDKTGIQPDPKKIHAILQRDYPKNVTDVRSFLNAAGYMRNFIPGFAQLATPLYELTKGSPKPGTVVRILTEHKTAFDKIKASLTSAPLLKSIQFGKPVVIDTDASNNCVGAVLFQPFFDHTTRTSKLHPIAYESHKLTKTQERELFAIVFALKTWKNWVEGTNITIRTDHQSLTGIRAKHDLPSRIARFLGIIEHFDPLILYRKGSFNHFPDWLSRPAIPQKSPFSPPEMQLFNITENLSEVNWQDIERISEALVNHNPVVLTPEEHVLTKNSFLCIGNILYKRDGTNLLQVNDELSLIDMAKDIHKTLGHCSAAAIERQIRKHHWNSAITLLAQEAVRQCDNCTLRLPQDTIGQTLDPLPPAQPFCRWGLDFTGPITV